MMELTEVVSPSVAVPVLCVLVCAFLVFAFGFKSPAQPPSFDVFDDDGKKKRTKRSKGSKGQTNGHAVVSSDTDVNNSAKQPQPSPRQTVKQSSKVQTSVNAKSKSVPQVSQESSKKVKKQSAKEEDAKTVKKQEEMDEDFDAGWHMVPKKDKKQKKRDAESKQDKRDVSPVKEDIVIKADDGVAAASSVEVETPGTPQEQRSKKKKDKKNKKTKQEEDMMEQIKTEVLPEKVVVKETEPVMDDNNIELQIKEAMETTVEETISAEKKKKNKKDRKKTVPEDEDFVIPNAAIAQEAASIGAESIDNTPLKENTDALTVKVPKKKQKKDRNKRNEESIEAGADGGASASIDTSLSKTIVSESQPKKTSQEENTSVQVKSSIDQCSSSLEVAASSDVSAPTSSVPVFDELGTTTDSWTEAKPKSKKKKARRAD